MKKYILFAAALLGLVACNNKEEVAAPLEPGKPCTLTATINLPEQNQSSARMIAPVNPSAATVTFKWQEGDQITISRGTEKQVFTVVNSSISGNTANFTGDALTDMSSYTVTYGDVSSKSVDYIAGSYKPFATGEGANNEFTITSYCPVLELKLTGTVTLTSIKYYVSDVLSTTLNIGTGVALSSTATTIYFPVIDAADATKAKLEFCDADGVVMSKTAPVAIEKSKVYGMPALEVVGSSIPKYICFESLSGNSTVAFRRTTHNLEWSTDGTNWSDDDKMGTQTLSGSQKLYIRATSEGNSTVTYSAQLRSLFNTTGNLKVSGNVMYLLNGTSPSTTMTSENNTCFRGLFHGQTAIHDFSDLTLPATTLADNCYEKMFYQCWNAANCPSSLPAMQMKPACYQQMFAYCSTLVNAPALPATTLAKNCYNAMFSECTSLQTAPSLPAESLATKCYANMFSSCTKLASVTMLATNGVDNSNLEDWLGFHAGESASGTPTVTVASGMKTAVEGTLDTSVWTVVEQK